MLLALPCPCRNVRVQGGLNMGHWSPKQHNNLLYIPSVRPPGLFRIFTRIKWIRVYASGVSICKYTHRHILLVHTSLYNRIVEGYTVALRIYGLYLYVNLQMNEIFTHFFGKNVGSYRRGPADMERSACVGNQ